MIAMTQEEVLDCLVDLRDLAKVDLAVGRAQGMGVFAHNTPSAQVGMDIKVVFDHMGEINAIGDVLEKLSQGLRRYMSMNDQSSATIEMTVRLKFPEANGQDD